MEERTEKEINYKLIEALVAWRTSLSNGRAKPDRNGNLSFIRDSGEYIGFINQIDEIIADELNITEKFKTIRNDSNKTRPDFGFMATVPGLED